MKNISFLNAFLLCFLIAPSSNIALMAKSTFALDVNMTKLRNTKGNIIICIWSKADKGFPRCNSDSHPYMKKTISAVNTRISFSNVPAGEYAVSVLHDEKKAGRPETNLLGFPTSGIGLSNNPKIGPLHLPNFSKAQILVPKTKAIIIEMRYLF